MSVNSVDYTKYAQTYEATQSQDKNTAKDSAETKEKSTETKYDNY